VVVVTLNASATYRGRDGAKAQLALAFLAPDLVKVAVEGRLPRGIGVTRLRDAPAEWSRQYAMLGLSISSWRSSCHSIIHRAMPLRPLQQNLGQPPQNLIGG
jgi:hypothetical protein